MGASDGEQARCDESLRPRIGGRDRIPADTERTHLWSHNSDRQTGKRAEPRAQACPCGVRQRAPMDWKPPDFFFFSRFSSFLRRLLLRPSPLSSNSTTFSAVPPSRSAILTSLWNAAATVSAAPRGCPVRDIRILFARIIRTMASESVPPSALSKRVFNPIRSIVDKAHSIAFLTATRR
jgi:hypothetical protein